MNKYKRAILILIFCALVGAFHNLPYLLIKSSLGKDYRGIVPETTKDERHYLRQIQTAMDGDYQLHNRYVYEYYKQAAQFSIMGLQPYDLYGLTGRLLHLDFWKWIFISRTLFPIIAFLLLFRIFRALNFGSGQALLLAFFNLITPFILLGRSEFLFRHIFEFLQKRCLDRSFLQLIFYSEFPYARLVNPNLSGLFFLASFLFLIKWIKKPRKYFYLALSLVFFFVCFKFYFYFWSSLAVFYGLLFLYSIMKKNWRIALPLGVIALAGGIYALPKVLRIYGSIQNSFSYHSGLAFSRAPIFSPASLVSIIALILIFIIKKKSPKQNCASPLDFLIISAPIAILIMMNQQIITGVVVQPWHYELFTSPLLLSIFIFSKLLNKDNLERVAFDFFPRFFSSRKIYYPAVVIFILTIIICCLQIFLLYFRFAPSFSKPMLPVMTMTFTLFVFASAIALYFARSRFAESAEARKRLASTAWVIAVLIIIGEGASMSVIKAQSLETLSRKEQRLSGALAFLDSEPLGSVAAHPAAADIIALFTKQFVYVSTFSSIYPYPSAAENKLRAYNLLAIYGASNEDFIRLAKQWPYSFILWGMKPIGSNKDMFNFGAGEILSDDEIKTRAEEFSGARKKIEWNEGIDFKLDYVLYGPFERVDFPNAADNGAFKNFERQYSDNDAAVYYIKRAQ